jgi:hypothetical protein
MAGANSVACAGAYRVLPYRSLSKLAGVKWEIVQDHRDLVEQLILLSPLRGVGNIRYNLDSASILKPRNTPF